MPSKWDAVLESKPVPLGEHLLTECSKLFASELAKWPPPVTEATGDAAALLAGEPAKPSWQLMREAFRLARWDLGREHDAYDDYMRNQRFLEAGVAPADKPMLLFVSRLIEEQLLGLGEATEGRVDRKAMLRVLDLTERAVVKPGAL
ncbi:MAG: hypothetical protein JNK82_02375 [Myxococcaceae bacterium]|nr:hypothetical protein [Myxococcaceae bacterium]